ncbi:MAG: hypothetical protein ACFFE5_12585, partial [Candidatus Thorarchaeota archaeon]
MRKTRNKPYFKLIILLCLSNLFFTMLYLNLGFNMNIMEMNKNNSFDTYDLKTSKVSGRIHIKGSSGWLNFKNDGNCTGTGTIVDPYVIEDLIIDGEGLSSCIWIEDSNVHFRIENCTVYNSG